MSVLGMPTPAEETELARRIRLLALEQWGERRCTTLVGRHPLLLAALEKVMHFAQAEGPVLITGESGTGKELFAHALYLLSNRRKKPFIAVNCAQYGDGQLIASELFGHRRGSFTGAFTDHRGVFEEADGGVVMLDEVGELSPQAQAMLLRALSEGEIVPVGETRARSVNVRVIAATNRDLRDQVQRGEFRRDLYHRLNVLRIDLPALRERQPDIPRLIERFIREFSAQHERPFMGIDPEAVRLLMDYDWPGNVRELRNLVESMVVLAPGRVIRPEDIPAEVRFHTRGGSRSLMPVPVPMVRQGPPPGENGHGEVTGPPPELEFIFRTMFDLRMDLDDLRREFEIYRQRHREPVALPGIGGPLVGGYPPPALAWAPPPPAEPEPAEERGVVVFRPGMTMEEMERQAIGAALREARGNRRRAAEMLGIGERTLYRKLKEYQLEA